MVADRRGPERVPRHQQLPDVPADGGGPGNLHRGIAGRTRRAGGGAAGAGGRRRIAVRLLHARLRHEPVCGAVPARSSGSVRSAWRWRATCAAAPATVRFATRRCALGPAPAGLLPRPARSAVALARARSPRRLLAAVDDRGVRRSSAVERPTRRSSPAAPTSASNRTCDVHALAAPRQRRSRSTSCTSSPTTDVSVRIGAALPLTEIERHVARRARRRARVARRSSPPRRSATARRSAAISPRRRRSATRRRCCWRSMRRVRPRRRRAARRTRPARGVLHGLPQDSAAAAARSSRPSRSRSRSRPRSAFYKVAKRRLDDISTVAAAMAIDRRRRRRVRRARFAFGGVAATPLRVREAEDAVDGQPWNDRQRRPRAAGHRSDADAARAITAAPANTAASVSQSLVEKFWLESQGMTIVGRAACRTRARAATSRARRSTPTTCCALPGPAPCVAGDGAARACARARALARRGARDSRAGRRHALTARRRPWRGRHRRRRVTTSRCFRAR